MAGLFADLASVVIAKGLDASSLEHRAIADNIANVDTPGYVREDVSFDVKLKDALTAADPNAAMGRVEKLEPQMVQDSLGAMSAQGNNVSIDQEMADLTANTDQYETLIRLMTMKASMLQTAINGGK